MPVHSTSALQPPLIPGEIIIRLSSEGRAQAEKSRPYVPLSSDVTSRTLKPAEGLGITRVQKIFERHDLPVRVSRPLSPRFYARTGEARPLAREDFAPHERQSKFDDLYVLKTDKRAERETLFKIARELRHEAAGIIENAVPRRTVFTFQKPGSAFYFHQWGLWRMGCEDAWETQKGSADVTVAVIDTGVDAHSDLVPNLLPGSDYVTTNVLSALPAGWSFDPDPPVRTNNSSLDDEKHGTHVAGIVGAQGLPGYGVAGVAWDCKLLPVRCMARVVAPGGYSTGAGHPDDIANAIVWAADEGARVINLSLGSAGVLDDFDGTISGDLALETAVQHALGRGCFVVAAVGNEGTRWPFYPASFKDVFGVGAVDWEDRRPAFSNWGEQVEVVAPGVNILSTALSNEFAMADGTSQAAPHVSGLAALLFSQHPQATAAQVAQAIRDSADRVSDNSPAGSPPGKHLYYGWGRVNARRALDKLAKIVAP